MLEFEYGTKEERDRFLAENPNIFLIEERNVAEGNYIVYLEENPQVQRLNRQISELESRTKLLEYNTQNMGETLDVHEGAIVDVMNLALGTPPNEL